MFESVDAPTDGRTTARWVYSIATYPVYILLLFRFLQYMGRWYEYERYFTVFEIGSKCVSADYTLQSDNSVKVNNTGYYPM